MRDGASSASTANFANLFMEANMTTQWTNPDIAGLLPFIFLNSDPASAKEQIAARYVHGGGWWPFEGFTYDPDMHTLRPPGEPPRRELSRTLLHLGDPDLPTELLILFQDSWVAIVQPDGTYEVCRMD